MKKSVKKFLTQIGAGALICTVMIPCSTFKASPARISEEERAAQIQQSELRRYQSGEWESVQWKIAHYKEGLKVLEQISRTELDAELARLLQIEEDINARKRNCSSWSWESWNLSNQLSDVKRKISSVRSKISANESNIKHYKKKIEEEDHKLAIILQNQEANGLY